jgi:hypothetical protein
MFKIFLIFALIVSAGIYHWITDRRLTGRVRVLEQNLQHLSDVVTQIADVQMTTFQKHNANFEDLEERIMELSVPSHDSSMPLERRHQVLALSRQGVGLDEIVKRLKAPVGEAELILNLQKYMGGEISRSSKTNERVRKYA